MDYISDILANQYQEWLATDEVFIQTPTGSGKTTFVLKTLTDYAREKDREVLLLVNRKILKYQIRQAILSEYGIEEVTEELKHIRDFNGLTVMSYQEIQEQLKKRHWKFCSLLKSRYFYIVFDEVHYFLQDATFNRDIPYLLGVIPEIKNATKIFMSATIEEVYPYLRNLLKRKEIPTTWEGVSQILQQNGWQNLWLSYQEGYFRKGRVFFYQLAPRFQISRIQYIQKIEEVAKLVNKDETEEKWLVFVNSKSEAAKLKKQILKRFAYLDADVDDENDIRQEIEKTSKFSAKVLITTKVLDNGVNIMDEELKNIVLLTTEKTEFLQMMGRKRFIDGGDQVRLFIMRRDLRYFNGVLNLQIQPIFRFFDEIEKDMHFSQDRLDDEGFFRNFQKMAVIRNGQIFVSEAAKYKMKQAKKFCEYIIEKLKGDESGFIKEQLLWLGMENTFSEDNFIGKEEEDRAKSEGLKELEIFLKEHVNQKISNDKKNDFRLKVKRISEKCGEKLTDRDERVPGLAIIKKFLERTKLPYEISSKGNSSYWVIQEVPNETENICF